MSADGSIAMNFITALVRLTGFDEIVPSVVPGSKTPTLLSSRMIASNESQLDADTKSAAPIFRRQINGTKPLSDPKKNPTEFQITNGNPITVVKSAPTEEQTRLWWQLQKQSEKRGELCVNRSNILEIGWPCIEEGLQKTTAQNIVITSCGAGGEAAQVVARALERNPNVVELTMDYNNIDDDGAVALARTLECNANLKRILLQGNNIGDAGAVAFARALKCNSSLVFLDLTGNTIGERGAFSLIEAFGANIHAKDWELWLRANPIGDVGEHVLRYTRGHDKAFSMTDE